MACMERRTQAAAAGVSQHLCFFVSTLRVQGNLFFVGVVLLAATSSRELKKELHLKFEGEGVRGCSLTKRSL